MRKQLIPFKPQVSSNIKNGGQDQTSAPPKILRFASLPNELKFGQNAELKFGQSTTTVQRSAEIHVSVKNGGQDQTETTENSSRRKRSYMDNSGRAYLKDMGRAYYVY